jgi:type VI secretion system secreted protein VgrG
VISSPKEVVITGGSSQIALNNSGIFPKTGGKFEVNAGQHLFKPGVHVNVSQQALKSSNAKGVLELFNNYIHGEAIKQGKFKVVDVQGKEHQGVLDDKGFARISGIIPGSVKVFFEGDQRDPWAETSDLKRQAEWPTAQQLQGFNPDMIFNSISKMKNTRSDVSKAFSNASSLVANLHKLKK